jgi:DNA polymerase-3 subunit beta
LFVDKNKIGVDLKDTQIITRPIEGDFPDYNQYIPKPQSNKLVIDRRVFLSALKRAAIFSTTDYQSIKIELKKNEIIICEYFIT